MLSAAALLFTLGAQGAAAAPPVILSESFSGVTTASVTLEAEINPEGKATQYHFEFGGSACSSGTCTELPKGKAISGSVPVSVSVPLQGLAPHAAYHFRVVASHAGEAAVSGADATFSTYALPQVFAPCGNDALRANRVLPDCRAYEQASPVEKNSVDARGRVALMKAASGGGAITYGAAGGIPGAEGAQDLPTYLATRGAGGWSTQGLFPPQSAGESVFVVGWTPDLAETFTSATRLGPPRDTAILQRSSSDHSLTEVIPYGKGFLNPALAEAGFGFAGTSANGGEVVIESKAKLLPAAMEGKPNVYIWDKESGKLSLASALNSVSPEGQAPAQGAFAGSYDWIAGTNPETLAKGGAVARYYTQDSHAISSGGAVIFTSAGSGQLYMRRNPGQGQSAFTTDGKGEEICSEAAKACTLHISASEKDNGTLGGRDAAGTRPAAFLAASADGSRVLFSSSEKLTNDATTGKEPPPAAIGRADLAGTGAKTDFCPAHIAKGVAVDGAHIYWADPTAGTINRAGLECESPEAIVSGANNPQYVAVDSEHLYWTNAGDGKAGTGTIGRAKPDGSEVNGEFIIGATNPQGIAVEGEFIYWANAGEENAQTIGRAKLGTGGAEEVDEKFIDVGEGFFNYRPQGLAVNATHIYTTVDGGFLQDFRFLFRFDIGGNLASRVLFPDGQSENNEVPGVRGVALDASHVYWARQGEDAIGRCNLELEKASCDKEFIKEAGHPLGLAADGAHLYWAVNGEVQPNPGNDLYRYEAGAPAGKRLSDLVTDPGDVNGAEVKGILGASEDARAVYFVANGDLDGAGPAGGGDCNGSASGLNISFSGQCNLYLWREGAPTAFIARLDGADAQDWVPRGGFGEQDERSARVAADGSAAIFLSRRQLTAYDNKGVAELYRYETGPAGLTCISCNPSGPVPAAPGFGSISLSTLVPPEFTYTLSRNLSANGRRVFFETTEALVSADINGQDGCETEGTTQKKYFSCQDVYEWEAAGEGSCKEDIQGGGCLYLLSSGKSAQASFFGDASASGNDAFLATAEAGLVGQDQDQFFDVFDARTEGGLAAQNQVATVPCEGAEACHGPLGAVPGFQSPASASVQNPGNPRPRCPKGKRRVKGRCVASHHKRQHRHKHRRAGAGRKGGNR